jgi:uncharacterized protein YndB with AHSA1/START domain
MTATILKNDNTDVFTDGTDLVTERIFNAPRDLVWKVMHDPKLVTKWWGPRGYTTTVLEMDVRPGGAWRFINHTTGGEDVPFKGEYREVVPPEKVVYTFIVDIEGIRDQVGLITTTLEDLGGRTKLTDRSHFGTLEALEGALSTGMVEGGVATYDRLEELIATM